MDGQREALEVIRRALDGEAPAEERLVDLEDILEGALEDARSILGMEEGGGRSVIALGQNPCLPRFSRSALKRMNPSAKRGTTPGDKRGFPAEWRAP